MLEYSLGKISYCKKHNTKYTIKGRWADYFVVEGPKGYPSLRKPETLTDERPSYIKVRKRTGGASFLKRLRTKDEIKVGELLVDLTFNSIFEVTEVNCEAKPYAQIMEAYRLGERV